MLRLFHFKTLAMCVIVMTMFASCSKETELAPGEARVKGRIINPTRDYVVIRERFGAGAKRDTVPLSEKGEFEIFIKPDTLTNYVFSFSFMNSKDTISTDSANIRLISSRESQDLNLMINKGDDLKIWIDTKDPVSSLSVSGPGAELNRYTTAKSLSDYSIYSQLPSKLRSSPEEFFRFINMTAQSQDELIRTLLTNPEKLPPKFRENEEKKLLYRYSRLRLSYINSTNKDNQFVPDSSFFSFMKDIPFDKPEETRNSDYMQLISSYADQLVIQKNGGKQLERGDFSVQKYFILKSMFSDSETRDIVLYDYLKKKTKQSDSGIARQLMDDFISTAGTDSLKTELTKLREMKENLSPGNAAPAFSCQDTEGKIRTLSEFRGKYVYIDVWATWCKPCLYEAPFLSRLENDYIDRNIEFIGISIDDDRNKWLNMIAAKQMAGVQLLAGSESQFVKDYMISGIPRFILIGPDGTMLNENAPRPSGNEIRQLFESLSGL